MHKGHKLITQNEKAQCQVLLEILKLLGNLLQPEVQEIQRSLKLEAENGHIIFICLQQVYLT